jgi:uncharacterized membrane protein
MTAPAATATASDGFQPFNLVGLVGILFTVVGGIEIGTQLFPMSIGNPEWEFGTFSAVMDSMPPLLIGLGFLGVFAVVRKNRLLGRAVAIFAFTVALVLIGFAFLYATNVPQALKVNPRSAIETGIKKAVTKASFQTAIFPVTLIWLGAFLVRNTSHSRR